MSIIPKPPFPNVPNLPGVPQLPRSLSFLPGPPPVLGLALAIGKLWQSIFTTPQWAIYKSLPPNTKDASGVDTLTVTAKRTPVVVPDSFGEFSYRNEWSESDYVVQEGAFATYNKVANPFEIMVRLYKGGSKQDRKKFIDSIDAIAGTLDFYDIITPEKSYLNVNVLRNELVRRGVGGAYMFTEMDIYFREVRETTATYSTTATSTQNSQSSSATPAVNTGSVQAQPTTIKTGAP